MTELEAPEPEPTIDKSITSTEVAPVQWSSTADVEVVVPAEELDGYPTVHTPTAEPAQPPTPDFNSVAGAVPIQPVDLAPAVTADAASVAMDILPAADIPPPEPAPDPVAPALADGPVAATDDVFLASQPSSLVRRMPPPPTTFGAEPALPSSARPSRFVVIGSAAAAVLVAAVVSLALQGKSGGADDAVRLAPNSSAPGVSATTTAAGAAKGTPFVETRTPTVPPTKPSAYGPNLPLPPQPGRRMRPSADDYIAPPYSNMPPVQPESASQMSNAAPVPITNGHQIREISNSATPVSPAASVRSDADLHVNGDPDKRLVGDLAARSAEPTVFFERPSHPSVPSAEMTSNLISAPRPAYPMLAKLAHAEGEVTLEAEISRTGAVSPIRVVSGHHLLRHAAEDAVRRWRYRPYVVNGRAVEISTTITVHFRDH
jgi:protein TonB